jgi:DNA-binding SARP family transcriptional activator
MLRINTFGGLSLHQDGGPITGAPTQRRRLALFALLAVAGEKGMSRDKLLVMLWPDGDPAKSRHALNQILSAQRRYFSDARLFDGKKTVRLNAAVITSDVAELEQSLAIGDVTRVAQVYSGPFLDGFFVPNSAEFEMWASDKRDRFAGRVVEAFENAARLSQASGDLESAARLRRQAHEVDRGDPQRAISYADTLLLAGNSAAALRVLRATQERMKSELGGVSDSAIVARIEDIARGKTT